MTIPYPDNPLGQRLKAARGSMLSKDLAQAAKWPVSKVSKIEHGRQLPSVDDLDEFARITGATETALEQWKSMLEQILADQHTFRQSMAGGQRALQERYNRIVEQATSFRFYEKLVVPRFAQTVDYTRGVVERAHLLNRPDVALNSPEAQQDIEQTVAERQSGTRYLYDTGRHFEIVLDEGILHTWYFSLEIMDSQLARLQSIIGLPNVRFGILPQHRLLTATGVNSFDMYDDLVYVETTLGDDPLVRTEDVEAYRRQLDRLWADAVEGDEAYALIEQARAHIPH